MKKIILSISMLLLVVTANLLSINYASAQTNAKVYLRIGEISVKDVSVASKALLKMDPSYIKASNGVVTGKNTYSSESGLVYAFTSFNDLGKLMQENGSYWNKTFLDNPGVSEEMSANALAPNVSSIWVRFNEATNTVANFKSSDYDFRRIIIVNVVVGKVKEYEALLIKQNELMLKYGFNYNKLVFKSVIGYTQNSYLTIIADHSMTEHLASRSERMKKISETLELSEVSKALRACTIPVKVDFLYRFK
jgi:hypothetical protein